MCALSQPARACPNIKGLSLYVALMSFFLTAWGLGEREKKPQRCIVCAKATLSSSVVCFAILAQQILLIMMTMMMMMMTARLCCMLAKINAAKKARYLYVGSLHFIALPVVGGEGDCQQGNGDDGGYRRERQRYRTAGHLAGTLGESGTEFGSLHLFSLSPFGRSRRGW